MPYGCLEKGFKLNTLDPRPHAAAAPQPALRLLISPPAHIDKPIVDLPGLQAATPIDIQVLEDVQRVSNKFSKISALVKFPLYLLYTDFAEFIDTCADARPASSSAL